MKRVGLTLLPALLAAGCTEPPPPPEPRRTEVPEELRRQASPPPVQAQPNGEAVGTPMAERVATIGVLNKRNNLTQDLEMRPGEARRVGDVVVRLSACERTAPWEVPPETGAFVQVMVAETDDNGQEGWRQVFSGWLFKNSPSLNVVEHPIYDVWVKDCAMSFPGEEAPAAGRDGDEPRAPRAPSTPVAPAA